MPTIPQQISARLAQRIQNYRCCAMFDYGSRVYGYKAPDDYDMIVVIKWDADRDGPNFFYDQFTFAPYNVTVMCEVRFFELVGKHEITAMECLWLPEKHIPFMDSRFKETFDRALTRKITLSDLRHSISKKASNSYVKAKKKLTVEEDFDLECSVKSLFHSLRILQFGTQLATTGKISNYAESNKFYVDIIKNYQESHLNWEEINKTMKPIYNQLATEFKAAAPKDLK